MAILLARTVSSVCDFPFASAQHSKLKTARARFIGADNQPRLFDVKLNHYSCAKRFKRCMPFRLCLGSPLDGLGLVALSQFSVNKQFGGAFRTRPIDAYSFKRET